MMRLFRFVISVIVVACVVSLLVRYFSDLDARPEGDPYNVVRGVGVWLLAFLIASLNEVLIARRANKVG